MVGRGAYGASAADIAVGEKHLLLLVERLLDRFAVHIAVFDQPLVDEPCQLLVFGRMRCQIVVHADAKRLEVAFMLFRDSRDQGFGANAFLLRAEHRGRAMCVAGTDIYAIVAAESLEPDPDVGLNVLDEMAEVQRIVRVRQCARYEDFSFRGH